MNNKCILIVDDDELNRAVLSSVFEDDYEIIEAENGLIGLDLLKGNYDRISMVLLDMIMPVMGGLEFLRVMRDSNFLRDIPVFIVTSETRASDIAEAYNLGASDVIAKPVIPFVVHKRVDNTVELYESRKALSSEVEIQKQHLLDQQQKIIELNYGMLEALCVTIEFRSNETGLHVRNIRTITDYLLRNTEMGAGLSSETIELVSMASMMHDIGKISIPDAILNKPGRLTPEEFEIMKSHTTIGAKVLKEIPQLIGNDLYNFAYDIALHHHERDDGRGYPEGLKGDEISTFAKVVSIADVYDALISKRVYKKSVSHEKAVEMIKNGECGAFDKKLMSCFLQCEPEIYKLLYERDGE